MERSEAQSDLSEGGVMRDNTLIQSACNIQGTCQGLLICVVSTGGIQCPLLHTLYAYSVYLYLYPYLYYILVYTPLHRAQSMYICTPYVLLGERK